MVTLIKRGETTVSPILELCGLSTDTKPTEYNGDKVSNGSTFYEMDTTRYRTARLFMKWTRKTSTFMTKKTAFGFRCKEVFAWI